MATKTQHPPSTSSRIRFGFGPKHSRSRPSPHEPPEHENDEDWYIPYNGPYEMPPPPSNTYDSSGRLLGSALVHPGSAKSSEMGHEWPDGRMAGGQSMMSALPSSGSHSSHPYRMAAASDTAGATPLPTTTGFPARGPISSQTLRSGRPTLITSSSTAFANIDSTGGVGESPTPVQRSSPLYTSPPPSSRLSFGNFLIFNGSTRKSRSDSVHSTRQSSRKLRARNRSMTLDPLQLNRATATAIPDARHPPRSHSHLSLSQVMERGPRQRSQTLIGTSTAAAQTPSPSHDSYATSFYSRESPLSSHPYAHTFSASRTESQRRAPIVISPSASRSMDKGKGVDRSHQYSQLPVPDTLSSAHQVPPHLRPASRTSLFKTFSAPNLRNFSRDFSIGKHIPRGKYRWLSPETWCDAMLFPRPRFMEYIDDDPPSSNHQQPSLIRPSETTRPARKLHRPLQMTLRGSQSAVNLLAPNSGSSTGPPRAEPMLQRGPANADGQTSPARPFSFAQDDIALPSPVLSLTRVLEMKTSFEHERAEWKAQAARSLQSSKRTRSLGRSRSQSVGRTRAQLKDMGGMGFLATKTLLGNQLAAPTVHARTPSDSTQTRSGTSHARTNSSGGISRTGSKSRAALRAATGLCVSDDKMSPQDERNDIFSRIDSRSKVVRIEAAAPSADVVPSPSPLVNSNSDVGVAVSSPLPAEEDSARAPTRSLHTQDHPYVQGGGGRSASKRSQHERSGSDYAGPHPSAVSIAVPSAALTSDMSARHRLPPHAALHPYASVSAYQNTASSQHSAAFHPKGSHQDPPEDAPPPPWSKPQEPPKYQPQVLDASESDRVGAHAYASASASDSRLNSEPLAFADALSYGLRRPSSADSGVGESETHFGGSAAPTSPYTPIPNLVLTTMAEGPLDSASAAPESSFLLPSHSSQTHTVASSPPEPHDLPAFTASVLSYSLHSHSAQASLHDEPLVAGSGSSSPQRSPRPFSSIEDLDRYRNLFYRPRGSGSSRTPSGEHRRVLSGGGSGLLTGQDASSNSYVPGSAGSGLTTLTRQLSNELDGSGGGLLGVSQPHMWGLRYGGLMGSDGAGSRTDPNAVLSMTSDSDMNTSSPGAGAAVLPFSMHRSFGRQSEGSSLMVPIPQDVESRSTSSELDRSEIEEVHEDELLRIGTVEAISTPSATTPPINRLSFMGDVHEGISRESLALSQSRSRSQLQLDATANNDSSSSLLERPPLLMPSSTSLSPRSRSSRGSLAPVGLPSATTEVTRSSYLTDGTGASRISGLSDFPAPPSQTVVPSDRVEFLKSYFDDGSGSGSDGSSRPVSSQIDRPARASSGVVRSQRPSLVGPSRLSESRERPALGTGDGVS